MSEEEKARRLTEMSGNADVREEARWARLHAARKRDDSEEAVEAAARAKAAAASKLRPVCAIVLFADVVTSYN